MKPIIRFFGLISIMLLISSVLIIAGPGASDGNGTLTLPKEDLQVLQRHGVNSVFVNEINCDPVDCSVYIHFTEDELQRDIPFSLLKAVGITSTYDLNKFSNEQILQFRDIAIIKMLHREAQLLLKKEAQDAKDNSDENYKNQNQKINEGTLTLR
jgi:hypothetical protein